MIGGVRQTRDSIIIELEAIIINQDQGIVGRKVGVYIALNSS